MTIFALWIDYLGQIPVNQHAASLVWFFAIDDHDIHQANVTMKNARIVCSFVSCN
jgi:hypothetical protein